MQTYLKYKPAWLQLVIFGSLSFGIYLSLGLVAYFSVAAVFGIPAAELQDMDLSRPDIVLALKWLQGILSVVIFLVPSLLFAYLSDRSPLRYIGIRKPLPASFLLLGLLVMVLAFPAASWLNHLNQQVHFPAWMKDTEASLRASEKNAQDLMKAMLNMKGPADLAAMLFLIALVPAFCEEFFFRGALQRIFIHITRNPWLGIIITSVLFSAFHGQFLGFFPRLFLGILLGAVFWYSGSIWPGILAHFVNNAIQVIYVYRDPSYIEKEPVMQPMIILFSIIAVAILLWYMRRISHTHYGELYDTDDDLVLPTRRDREE